MEAKDLLTGRVAIITGGGTGMGRAMALRFAELGARVVVASRTLKHLEQTVTDIATLGGQALALPTDVRNPSQVNMLMAQTKVVNWVKHAKFLRVLRFSPNLLAPTCRTPVCHRLPPTWSIGECVRRTCLRSLGDD